MVRAVEGAEGVEVRGYDDPGGGGDFSLPVCFRTSLHLSFITATTWGFVKSSPEDRPAWILLLSLFMLGFSSLF